jgi:hypothetical protein
MVVLGFIIGWHRSGIFKPHIKINVGVDLNAAIFVDLSIALMCICVGGCPTFGGFSACYISNMATN